MDKQVIRSHPNKTPLLRTFRESYRGPYIIGYLCKIEENISSIFIYTPDNLRFHTLVNDNFVSSLYTFKSYVHTIGRL